MLRAIIFDFNGVIIDDEPLHFFAFREVLGNERIRLTRTHYYERYLAYDDRRCLREILADHERRMSSAEVSRLRRAKEQAYQRLLRKRLRLFPGAVGFIRKCASRYPLAIASGALQSEIQSILRGFNLHRYFRAVISADDVTRGKPHPETFMRACQALNRIRAGKGKKILARECLVIEDSLHGIEAAHQAGMKCVAVAHSYPLRQLAHADHRARSIRNLQLSQLEALFREKPERVQASPSSSVDK